jgi:hypothetical protein
MVMYFNIIIAGRKVLIEINYILYISFFNCVEELIK